MMLGTTSIFDLLKLNNADEPRQGDVPVDVTLSDEQPLITFSEEASIALELAPFNQPRETPSDSSVDTPKRTNSDAFKPSSSASSSSSSNSSSSSSSSSNAAKYLHSGELFKSEDRGSPASSFTYEKYDFQKAIDDFLSDDLNVNTERNELLKKELSVMADLKEEVEKPEKPKHRKRGVYKESIEEPNLYDDCKEMMDYSALMLFLSKIQGLVRDDKLHSTAKHTVGSILPKEKDGDVKVESSFAEFFKTPEECILVQTSKIHDILHTVLTLYDFIKSDDKSIDVYIDIMRRMIDRGGDEAYDVAVFDDSREKDIIDGIIVDHYRKQIVVAFRGSMNGSLSDILGNISLFQAWVTNPLLKLRYETHPLRMAAHCKYLLENQPEKLLVQNGVYNALMYDKSKAGLGSKYDFLMKNVLRLFKKYPKYKLKVTGTSFGGAMAQVFALHAAAETNPLINKPVRCYSFAAPKVGTLRYRRAIEALEELGHLRLLRILNEEDPVRFIPRELNTMCCFTGFTTFSLIFNQGLFYRKAGIELNLSEEGIIFTHPKVPHKKCCQCCSFSCNLFRYDLAAQCVRQGACLCLGWKLITFNFDEINDDFDSDAHSYQFYYTRLEKNKKHLVKFDLEELYVDSLDEDYGVVSPIYS